MKLKERVLPGLQKLAKAFLVPAALIAAASLMMGVSSFITNPQITESLTFLKWFPLQYAAGLLNKAGSITMGNLPLIYAISLASTMTDGDKEYAGFAGALGFLSFLTSMGILINAFPAVKEMFPSQTITTIYGIETVNTGMVGGIMIGIITANLHRRVRHVKFPTAFAFFQGSRFTPFASTVLFMFLGQVFPFLWVWLSKGINALAATVQYTGIFGPFIYATVEKLLIPTGLHNIWNTVIRDTAVSGVYMFPSGVIEGCRPAYFQYLIEGLPEGASLVDMVKFLRGGQIPMMMFALPAIALAIYQTADPDKRAQIKPLLIAGAFTAFFSNISEPVEFLFLFSAPALYAVYAVLNGVSYMLLYVFGSQLGGITSSILGFVLYGLLRPESRWIITLLVGIGEGVVCYLLFKWWIVRFNVKTPGRGEDQEQALAFAAEINNMDMGKKEKKAGAAPTDEKALDIIRCLGGRENITEVDSCMSRLRITLVDGSAVDEAGLKKTGCMGIVRPDDKHIQIVYGLKVGSIKNEVKKALEL